MPRSVKLPVTLAAMVGVFSMATAVSASCAAASCPIQSPITPVAGKWELSLDYSYIGQSTLMTGSDVKDPNTSTMHHTELETYTRTFAARIGYQIDAQWGISVSLPYVWRKHAHTHHHHGQSIHDEWDISGLGDTWIEGSYTENNSIIFGNSLVTEMGIKLATGLPRMKNSGGDEAEIPIQPGSGATDYRFGFRTQFPIAILENWDGQHTELPAKFVTRYTLTGIGSDGWRAGDEIFAGVHTDWSLTRSISVIGGFSGIYRMKAEAGTTKEDINSTGGQSLLADLGLVITLAPRTQWSISGCVPLYQNVNGEQLGVQSIAQTRLSIQL